MQLLCLGYPDRGFSPGRKECGPTTAPIGGYARPARFQGRLRMVRRNIPAQGRRAPIISRSPCLALEYARGCRSICSGALPTTGHLLEAGAR
jgi:hypothetical protein